MMKIYPLKMTLLGWHIENRFKWANWWGIFRTIPSVLMVEASQRGVVEYTCTKHQRTQQNKNFVAFEVHL